MRKCLVFLNFSTPFSNIFLYSHQVMSNSLWSHGLQHTRPPCPSPSPGVCSSSCPLNEWCRPTISSSVALFSCLSLSQHQSPFQWISSLHQVAKDWSFSFSSSPSGEHSGLISFRIDWFDLLAVQGTLESSAPQFESISSSALSLLYVPTLTSMHDSWKNHSSDYTALCQQSEVSAF